MKVLLHTSVGITNYLDPYYKVKTMGTKVLLKCDSSVTKEIFLTYTKVHQKSQTLEMTLVFVCTNMTRSCSNT